MFKIKAVALALLAAAFTVTSAYCQEKAENQQIQTISGTVTQVDTVGNSIVVNTGEAQVLFYVPDDAKINQGEETIGLMDVQESDPVTISYYTASPGKYVVVSIIDSNLANDME